MCLTSIVVHLEHLLSHCRIKPMVNQLEFNPYHSIPLLRKYCAREGISWSRVTSHSEARWWGQRHTSLADGPTFEHPVICDIAKQHGKTAAQVVLRWETQSGVIPLPKTTRPERLAENIQIFDSSSPQTRCIG